VTQLKGYTMPPITQAWVDFIGNIEDRYGIFEWFGHFTFPVALHPEQADRRWLRFVRQINRKLYGNRHYKHGDGCTWVRGTENQKREAIHYHAFFGNGVRKLRRLDFMDIWSDISSDDLVPGICRIWPYDGKMNAKSYLVKYQVKGGDIDVYVPPSLTDRLN
jgi:hypothetical protein